MNNEIKLAVQSISDDRVSRISMLIAQVAEDANLKLTDEFCVFFFQITR